MKTQLFCTEKEMDEIFKESDNLKLLSFTVTGSGVLAFYEENKITFPDEIGRASCRERVSWAG